MQMHSHYQYNSFRQENIIPGEYFLILKHNKYKSNNIYKILYKKIVNVSRYNKK